MVTTAARCSKYDEREVYGAALYTTYLRTYTAATYYTRQYIYNFYIKRHITVTGDPRRLNQEITVEEVMKAIKRLRNNRAVGPDGVSNEWYKYAGFNVAKKLADRFNKMMKEHNVIEAIETGLLIPLNKEGARKIWEKTRPIVLLN